MPPCARPTAPSCTLRQSWCDRSARPLIPLRARRSAILILALLTYGGTALTGDCVVHAMCEGAACRGLRGAPRRGVRGRRGSRAVAARAERDAHAAFGSLRGQRGPQQVSNECQSDDRRGDHAILAHAPNLIRAAAGFARAWTPSRREDPRAPHTRSTIRRTPARADIRGDRGAQSRDGSTRGHHCSTR